MNIKSLFIFTTLLALWLTACSPRPFDPDGGMTLISREDGSGTRGAFIELFGIQGKNASGEAFDYTVDTADITNSTSVMITSVAQNSQAIGYIWVGTVEIMPTVPILA